MTFKDGRLELVTDCQVVKLGAFLSKKIVVPLVGAEGDKSRRRKIPVLVRSQVDWVEGQLSRDPIDICKNECLGKPPNKKNGKKRGHCPHVGGVNPSSLF